ncbi:MAG: endospore germination permease [Oscillospiraceae bacterium]|nr:endospore germination permease [Oscillospiraceae bacterium]
MPKDRLSSKQMICIIVLFIFGSTVIMGIPSNSEQDSWISLILACAFSIPVVLVYARILHLFPEKNFCDIVETLVGKIGSKFFIILIIWYALHLGGLVMCNFHEFIALSDLPNTPHFVIIIPILVLVIYLAKSNLSTFGNWSVITLIITMVFVAIIMIFSFKDADFSNLLPIFNHDIGNISLSSYKIFSFPLAETVLIMGMFGSVKSGTNPYKVYITAILFGSLVLLFAVLRNIVVLGPGMLSSEYYPSYTTTRIISIGDFLTRIESTIAISFILAGLTKITVCLLAASNGLAKLFGVKDPKQLIVPTCVLMVAICFTSFSNIMEIFIFASDSYYIYAIPFQLIIPFVIWIIAEIRTHRGKIQLSA